jgi:hypothetical protein
MLRCSVTGWQPVQKRTTNTTLFCYKCGQAFSPVFPGLSTRKVFTFCSLGSWGCSISPLPPATNNPQKNPRSVSRACQRNCVVTFEISEVLTVVLPRIHSISRGVLLESQAAQENRSSPLKMTALQSFEMAGHTQRHAATDIFPSTCVTHSKKPSARITRHQGICTFWNNVSMTALNSKFKSW